MKRQLAATGLVVVLIASCSSGEATPGGLAEDMLDACSQGDSDAVRSMLAANAVFVYEDEPEEPLWEASLYPASAYGFAEVEDFDGDGEETLADILLAQCVLYGGVLDRIETSCESNGPDAATCTELQFTRFGGAPYPYVYEFTFEEEQLALWHSLPVDPEALEAGFRDWAEGMNAYRIWVRAVYPESYDDVLSSLPEDDVDRPIMLPESLELQHEMMDEYFADS